MEEENVNEMVSEVLKGRSNVNCCVNGCKSVHKHNKNISFHKFPKRNQMIKVENEFGETYEQERRTLWEVSLKMGKKVSDHMKVCSLHFKKEDFYSLGCFDRKTLLPNAVPSQNIPLFNIVNEKRKEKRSDHLQQRRNITLPSSTITVKDQNGFNEITVKEENGVNEITVKQENVDDEMMNLEENTTLPTYFVNIKNEFSYTSTTTRETQTETSVLDADIQVNLETLNQFPESISNKKELNSLTGLHSFALLNKLVLIFTTVKSDRIHKITDKSRVILILMKLKLDLPYVVLGKLFNVSPRTCKDIFIETVKILSTPFRESIILPTYQENQKNMPKCFEDFRNVRIIFNCTQIMVKKRVKKLYCKGTTIVKFMTGIAPSGLITFVSKGFCGRRPGKNIFDPSNLISKLKKNQDAIMVDKRFRIKEICDTFGIKVIHPPVLRQKLESSSGSGEAFKNAETASVHIKRSNQKIKRFKILNNRLPLDLLPVINDIFIIACAVTNLSNPILSDQKFL